MPPRTSKDDVTRSVRTSKDDVRANRASKDDVRKPFHLKDDVKKKRHDLIAKRNTKREEEAAFIFNKFDTDKSGSLDEAALHRCFTDLGFSNGRQNRTDEDTKEWVRKELKRGDKKGTGRLGYDDFVEYYNRYVVGHRRQFEHTFELGQQIGQGAFGAVYRAKRVGGVPGGVAAGELVAVKQVEKDRSDEVALELLHNEITIWEQLQHVNLVRLLDVFETDTTLSLVTELCRGGDLFERLAKVSGLLASHPQLATPLPHYPPDLFLTAERTPCGARAGERLLGARCLAPCAPDRRRRRPPARARRGALRPEAVEHPRNGERGGG